jgi:predicted O-linked N-acetylglucosamine transferase (SPINDLY family)
MLRKLRQLFNPGSRNSPESPDELFRQARTLQQRGQNIPAGAVLRRILELRPDHWESLNMLAAIALESGDAEAARQIYDAAVARWPDRAEAYYKRANASNRAGRADLALADYDRAIGLDPAHARALCNRGAVLDRIGRSEEALVSYDRAIAVDSLDFLTHYNRGTVLKNLKRPEEALASYEKAIEVKPDYVDALINRGNVLEELGRHEAALSSFERAIELNSIHGEAFHGRAVALQMLKRFDLALADYDKAIALKPDFAPFYVGRGNLLLHWQHYDAAVASYLRAIELQPMELDAQFGLGQSFMRLKQLDRAIKSFDRAVMLDAGRSFLLGMRSAAKMQACDWDLWSAELDMIREGMEKKRAVCNPMTLAAMLDSPQLSRAAAESWIREEAPPDDAIGVIASRPRAAKIRVGYFSSDFRTHPVALLAAGLFERHDRSRFDITAFDFGPPADDAMQVRLRKAFDRFIDVSRSSDLEVAALAREMKIDIAVDLNGITERCRTKIFAVRAAPIQINYLGYPGTMGAGYMDYMIADATVVPPALKAHYAEKIIYLPDSFLPFDSSYAVAEKTFAREELGLPPDGFVFCCFNNTNKITPDMFDSWMRILARIDRSVLWLSPTNATAAANLEKEASRRGVDPGRLKFATRLAALPAHVARLRAADLFLDTFPYNAHATALDALWAGLPVLTCEGQGFASRVASSLLRTLRVPQLITGSLAQYEDTATALAADAARLMQLRVTIAQARSTTALFDTARYARNLESAYEQVHDRYHAGAAPAHINEPRPPEVPRRP